MNEQNHGPLPGQLPGSVAAAGLAALDPRSILVRMPNWLGDVVMGTTALLALRNRYPHARITVLGRPPHRQLLDGLRALDDFIPLDRDKGILSILRQGLRLRKQGFDLGILLPNSFSSAAIFFVAGIRHRVGYNLNGRGWMLTRRLRPPMDGHRRVPTPMTEYYQKLLSLVDVTGPPGLPQLEVVGEDEAELDAYLATRPVPAGPGPLVLLNPGASYGPSKLWRGDAFAAAGDRLQQELGARIVILAGPGEEPLAREIHQTMRQPHLAMVPEILGLRGLKALVRRSDLMITTDAGPRHMAVALGIPLVVLIGSTDPRHTNYGLDRTSLLMKDVDCRPCHLKVCPIDHRCMELITVEEVVAAARERLTTG